MNETGIPKGLPSQFEPVFVSLFNENQSLKEEVNSLRRKLFGSSSERYAVETPIEPLGGIFDEAEQTLTENPPPKGESDKDSEGDNEETITVPAHTRKKGGRKPLPTDLPREVVTVDVPEHERICPNDGTPLVPAGFDVSEKLKVTPATFSVQETRRLKYACPCCEQHVARAPLEKAAIPGGMADPSALALVVTQKFLFALPLYRQELIFRQMGIDLPRITLARWVVSLGELVLPLVRRMREHLVAEAVLHCDETPVQVLKGTGKAPTAKTYMWVLASAASSAAPGVYFEYHPTRAQSAASAILEGFQGFLQVDGYAGYNAVAASEGVIRVACWAHVRRKFEEAMTAGAKTGTSLAGEVLELIKKLFLLEREWKDLEPEARLQLRKEKAPPVLEEIERRLTENRDKVPPKSKLGGALGYLADEWDGLVQFLKDGRVALSNNRVENFIRPFALGRKNWLFADTVAGAQASAALYSLVVSAKANGIRVDDYLTHLFTHLPRILPDADVDSLDELLPWRWKP